MTKLLTPKEVSVILRMGRNKTLAVIKDKYFPKIKVGRSYLVPEDKLEEWIEEYTYKEFKIKGLS